MSATKIPTNDSDVDATGFAEGVEGAEYGEVGLNDDLRLREMGYKQHMKRGFGYLGPISMTWGWLVACVFIQAMVFSLAELGSAYPTAGGLYYWSYVAAPEGWKAIACLEYGHGKYIWLCLYFHAQMLSTFTVMINDNLEPQAWQIYLIYLLHVIVCGILLIFPSPTLAKLSTLFAYLSTLTFFIILFAMPILTPSHNNAHQLFFESYNQTKWSSDGFVFLLTFLTPCWVVAGYDSTVHLAEETKDAGGVIPRAMWISTVGVSVLGWVFNVVLAYCAYDIDTVMSSPLAQTLGALLVSACGKGVLTKTLWFLTILSNLGVVFVMTTSSSRIFFAYARDDALPFSSWLSHINLRTKTPVNATFTLCVCIALLGLISIGSTTALNGLFAGSALAGAVAYLMPVLMRCINENNPDYIPGPFTLGKYSKPIRWIAVIWTTFTLPLFSFPQEPHPTASTMKWTAPIYFGILAIILPWYYFSARKWFVGPAKNGDLST